eukprot:scaffold4473_cov55-Attheya_sp.AAC.6
MDVGSYDWKSPDFGLVRWRRLNFKETCLRKEIWSSYLRLHSLLRRLLKIFSIIYRPLKAR